jgi:uncharacterized membrane protein YdfJ with MMPL/SSD domain
VVGLTLDYDIFLISRIYEYRKLGHSTESAVLRAMATQSHTISVAGAIMAVAFAVRAATLADQHESWHGEYSERRESAVSVVRV